MKWFNKSFDQMGGRELFDVLRLREQVFTIGQQCSEPDIDDIDLRSTHLFAYDNDNLVAYLRIYDKNNAKTLGRVVVNPDYQGKGLGRKLMKQAILYLDKNFPDKPIQMSAQHYLEKFYQSLGFVSIGAIYKEADIDHIFMQYAERLTTDYLI